MQDHVCRYTEEIIEMKAEIRAIMASLGDNKELVKTTNAMAINLELYAQESKMVTQQLKENMELMIKQMDKRIASVEERQIEAGKRTGEILHMVNELEKKPAKKWEKMMGSIITGIVALLLGYFAGHFF